MNLHVFQGSVIKKDIIDSPFAIRQVAKEDLSCLQF